MSLFFCDKRHTKAVTFVTIPTTGSHLPRPGDTWHLDDAVLTINCNRFYLWRAVDQDGNVLDILIQSRRHKQAAKKFFRKLRKGFTYVPRVIIPDKLQSYGAATREMLPGVAPRRSRSLNNRGENAHLPTRQRERRMQRFKFEMEQDRTGTATA